MAFSTDALAHATAGAAGGVIAMALLYPLENVRTRLVVQVKDRQKAKSKLYQQPSNQHARNDSAQKGSNLLSPHTHSKATQPRVNDNEHIEQEDSTQYNGSIDCIQQVIAKEGWQSLYSGLNSALVGVGVSSFVYFGIYSAMKQAVLNRTGAKTIDPWRNILVASASGVLNVFATMPIWVVNTRMQLNRGNRSILSTIQSILRDEGVTAFYKGLIPSLILVSNPAIQFVVYEQLVRFLNKRAGNSGDTTLKLSPTQYFVLGAIAKAVATVLTYPYQVVKSREQAVKGNQKSVNTLQLMRTMYEQEGLGVFFQGMSAKMSQTVTNSAFMFLIYEYLLALMLALFKTMHQGDMPQRIAAEVAQKSIAARETVAGKSTALRETIAQQSSAARETVTNTMQQAKETVKEAL